RHLGLGHIDEPPPPTLPWREAIQDWARDRRHLSDDGWPLASMLWEELGEWGRVRRALRRSSAPRGRIDALPWTASKRAYQLGSLAFFSNGSMTTARRWAERARQVAEGDDDQRSQARALILLGRVAAGQERLDAAADLYRRAMALTDPESIEWGTAAERCAN